MLLCAAALPFEKGYNERKLLETLSYTKREKTSTATRLGEEV